MASATHAAVVNIPTSVGNGADSIVDGNGANATTNYGAGPELGMRFWSGGRNERTYLRFDLPDDIDSVNSATISLYKVGSTTIKTLELHALTNETLDNWSEGAITFANAPAGTAFGTREPDVANSDELSSHPLTSGANTTVVIPTSVNLVNFLNSDTNGLATFILSDFDDSSTYVYFSSKEDATAGAFAPTLNLDYNPIPEPAGLTIIGLGIAALARRRCK